MDTSGSRERSQARENRAFRPAGTPEITPADRGPGLPIILGPMSLLPPYRSARPARAGSPHPIRPGLAIAWMAAALVLVAGCGKKNSVAPHVAPVASLEIHPRVDTLLVG